MSDYSIPELVEPFKCFKDGRGSYKILDEVTIPCDNPKNWIGWKFPPRISVSHPKVLRGMHWQNNFPQAKLVKVVYGQVLDVTIDIRPDSPTFKKAFAFTLTDNGEQLFIPRGFAHGFYNFGDTDAVFYYNVDNVYSPEDECGMKWSSIDFDWPIRKDENIILSNKDKLWKNMNDFSLEDLADVC